jgi:hypothetical protein
MYYVLHVADGLVQCQGNYDKLETCCKVSQNEQRTIRGGRNGTEKA